VIAAVGIIPVPLYFLGRNENVFPVLPALRIDLAVDRFDFGRVAVRIVATAERRIIRHMPRRIKPLMQRPILSGMVAMSGLTFLRMDERCQQASARKEELAKKVQGAVSLQMGALYEGKIVSNNVKHRHLNSGQRAVRSRSAHAPRHEASDANQSAVQIVRPDHRTASAVRSIHDSVVRNINPLAINSHAIVTVLSFPIGVINALRITAIAAGPFATVQALIPTVQLRVLMIVGASVTGCGNRQYDSEYCTRSVPKVIVHLTRNPGISV
jgi:hypothetical protein